MKQKFVKDVFLSQKCRFNIWLPHEIHLNQNKICRIEK